MAPSLVRVLIVEDHDAWLRFISTKLQTQPELEVSGQVSDGLEAVQLPKSCNRT